MLQLQPLNFWFENNAFASNFSNSSKFLSFLVNRLDSHLGTAPLPRFARFGVEMLSLVAVEQWMVFTNWLFYRLCVLLPSSEFR